MTAAISDEPNGWFVKDPSIHHPDYSLDGEGMSLQDIRHYYLRGEPEFDPSMEAAPWFVVEPSTEVAFYLCNVCRHINFHWLLRNSVSMDSGPILILTHMLAHQYSCKFCRLALAALCTADGHDHGVDDLGDGDNIIGCWITCCQPRSYPRSDGPAEMSICRRRLFDTSFDTDEWGLGLVGQSGFMQRLGSSEDDCVGRRIAPCADLNLVRDWFKICEEQHVDVPSLAPLLHHSAIPISDVQIRVIDVQDKCIVIGNDHTRYVALSYVWGKVDQLKLLTSNLADLSTPGALSWEKFRSRLPRTIFDAIKLTAALGERYLWVDALCLVQDAPDVTAQVQTMDVVYGMATWTLVAGAANNATTPLPRITEPTDSSQVAQHTECISGMTIGVILPSLPTMLKKVVWNTRAWTYQESTLSKRLLVVTKPQIFFTCRHGYTYCEDNWLEIRPPSLVARTGQVFRSGTERANNFNIYADAVAEYTRRQMTFHQDGLNAIWGVLNRFGTWFRSDFLSGLPLTELDQALLWYPSGNITRRKDQSGRYLFPSWSWVGWVGPCRYLSELALSCIQWRTTDVIPSLSTFCTSDDLRRPANDQEWLAFERDWTDLEQTKSNLRTHTTIRDSCWYERQAPQTLYLHPVAVQSARVAHPASSWKDGCLEFQALSCFFRITGDHAEHAHLSACCSNNYHELCALSIYGVSGYICGTVHVPASSANSLSHGEHEFIRLSRTRYGSDCTPYFDLKWNLNDTSFLSERQPEEPKSLDNDDKHRAKNRGRSDGCTFDIDLFDMNEPWCVYNVMLIQTTEGISRRVGLGKIHVAAFTEKEGGARWRDFVLA